MWSSLFVMSLVFGLLPYMDIRKSTPIFQDHGSLLPGQQKLSLLPQMHKGNYLSATAVANGEHGDIDCYLIQNNHIIASDEGSHNYCELSMAIKNDEVIIFWVVNHGIDTINYRSIVSSR